LELVVTLKRKGGAEVENEFGGEEGEEEEG
jgi:hypothetical protein